MKDKTEIISDSLLNSDTADNTTDLNAWLQDNDDNKKLYNILRFIRIPEGVSEYSEEQREDIWNDLEYHISKRRRSINLKKWISIAASLILIVGLSGYFGFKEGYNLQNSQIITMKNPLGTTSSFELPDGTKVKLNSGSKISYPSQFADKERAISIDGEVFLEVAHDLQRPFIVNTDYLKVAVVGTKFNVKAYKEDKNIKVTLTEGKVNVLQSGNNDILYMSPGEQVIYDKLTNNISKQKVNIHEDLSWTEGKLLFRNTQFRDIVTELQRKFNVKIVIESKNLENALFSGDFIRNETLDQVLHVIAKGNKISYKIEGDSVKIYRK